MADTLFGMTPEDIQAQRQAAAQQQAMQYAKMAPAEQVNYGGYMAGSQLGTALGGMMGAKDPVLEKAKMMQELSSSFDLTSEEGLISAARALSAKGMPREAMALAQKAQEAKLKRAQIAKEGALEKRYNALADAPAKAGKGQTLTKEERMAQFIADVRERQANDEEVSQREIEIADNYAQLLSSKQYFQGKEGELLSAPKRTIAGASTPVEAGIGGKPSSVGVTVIPTPASAKVAAKEAKGNTLSQMEFDSDISNITLALERVTPWATGWGSYLSSIPNTEAMALNDIVDTVKSGQFLNNLKALKEASATGSSGLGSVTEKEGAKVEAKIRSLNPKSKTFVEDLKYIKQYMETLNTIKAQQTTPQQAQPSPVPTPQGQQPAPSGGKVITPAVIQRVMEHWKGKGSQELAIQKLKAAGWTEQ